MKQIGNGNYDITWREVKPDEVKKPRPWEQVKEELEQKIAAMGLKVTIGEFKMPQAFKLSTDSTGYILVKYYRNGNGEFCGIFARDYEEGAEKLYEIIKEKIRLTRMAFY